MGLKWLNQIYLPSNSNMIRLAGIFNSNAKWSFNSASVCRSLHLRVATWPLGIRTNLTEIQIYITILQWHIFFNKRVKNIKHNFQYFIALFTLQICISSCLSCLKIWILKVTFKLLPDLELSYLLMLLVHVSLVHYVLSVAWRPCRKNIK